MNSDSLLTKYSVSPVGHSPDGLLDIPVPVNVLGPLTRRRSPASCHERHGFGNVA